MKWNWITAFAAVVLVGMIAPGCGDDSVQTTDQLSVQVSPEQLTFSEARLNETSSLTFSIQNTSQGKAALKVSDVSVSGSSDFAVDCGSASFDLIQDGSVTCVVEFTPTTTDIQNASIVIESNAKSSPDSVQVSVLQLGPQIDSIPGNLTFSAREGSNSQKTVRIVNNGSAPLTITGYSLSASQGIFEANHDTNTYGEISESAPIVLQPFDDAIPAGSPESKNNEFPISVTYSPLNTGNDVGELRIFSDDPQREVYSVNIDADTNAPCILITNGSEIDFGNSRIGQINQQVIEVQNCGSDTLDITQIEPVENAAVLSNTDATDPFIVDTGIDRPMDNTGTLETPIAIPPGGSNNFILGYSPSAEEPNAGKVAVYSTDPQAPRVELGLFGRGVINQCPTAIARGTIQGQAIPPSEQVEAAPLQTLILDGSDSNDGDGAVVDWVWEITRAPEGSVAELEAYTSDPSNPARKQLFLDLAGRYEISMTAVDDGNVNSCNTALVTVIVTPDEDIHIQLVWNNPEDPDQTDPNGADVDLHLLKMPIGRWFEQPYDNYFRNREPLWNPEHPSLDIDDTNGAGPENINMDDPVPCTWYAVGVHYWRQQFGTGYTTVRIFIEGGLAFEYPNKPLRSEKEWWDVARIHWPTGEIFLVDEMAPQQPDGMPATITDEMNESGLCGLGQ